MEILEQTYYYAKLKVLLPEKEGILNMSLDFDIEVKNLFIFSSEGINDEYAVSSYSLDIAKRMVGNLENQEYMDNDESPATYVPMQDNLVREEQNRYYIGNGRVYGQLKWTDDSNVVHPLVGIKVKLTFQDSYDNVYQYTDSNGNYDITFNHVVGNSDFECTLHIYPENDYVKVRDLIYSYEYVQVLPLSNNSSYQFDHTFGRFGIEYDENHHLIYPPVYFNGALQIFEAMYNYSNYAVSLSNDTNIPQCLVYYPVSRNPNNTDEALTYCYYNNANAIYLCSENNRNNETTNCPNSPEGNYPYVEGSWDVIGHEYGHHLQKHFFYQPISGTHFFNKNGILSWMDNNEFTNPVDDMNLWKAKGNGCALALKESWPTFFEISAQQTFSDDTKTIPTVGDYCYQSYKGFYYDFTSTTFIDSGQQKTQGESCELVIISILYRLWESDNLETWDNTSIDDEDLWNLMLNNPVDFSEFIYYLSNDSSINISSWDLGELLSAFHIAPYSIDISLVGSSYQLTFKRGNVNVTYDDCTYQFNNNEFLINFYDDNDNLILTKYFDIGETIISNDFTYVFESYNWDRILDIQTLGYYVKITANAKRTYTFLNNSVHADTGPYIAYERFLKPTNFNLTLDNSRYYEKTFTIPAGGSFVFNVTDTSGGYRLFQTFGNQDVDMQLFDSLGTLLVSSTSGGFSNNSLIYYYISPNTNYVLNVNLSNPQASALVKLSIIPCTGDLANSSTTINSVVDIYYHNSNNTYSTYVPQYESVVIRWTPVVSGYYCLQLTSNFDSYLYVINPESANLLIADVDYNDDYVYDEDHDLYDEDSQLCGQYDANKTYLIVIGKYDPVVAGSNISISFDLCI